QVVLTDFGFARIVGTSHDTATGAIFGTPAYMSPEQGQGKRGDARSDIYALGVILYELITNRLPFEADTPFAIIMKHIREPVPEPSKLRPDLPEAVEAIVLAALNKNPSDRYRTAGEMALELWEAVGLTPPPGNTPITTIAPPPQLVEVTGSAGLSQTTSLPSIIRNLPPQLTSFIGRAAELAELDKLISSPEVRLVTILGQGGIGKTRLSIQAATARLNDFANGVYFVPLQTVRSTDFLISAVADAVHFALAGPSDPRLLLLNYLSPKELLLILDNFEQLVPASAADFLTAVLLAAPKVKLVVTSHELLNLQEEWVYAVQGMSFPATVHPDKSVPQNLGKHRGEREESLRIPPVSPDFLESGTHPPDNFESYEAVQLFAERARQVNREFSIHEELADVVRICQLIEGAPLAIELAASWTRTLRCAVIAAEIQRNIDFLATSLRNIPERQRSMRAVFDHSWDLLSDEERRVYRRLSVFRDGFQREAARRVAGASLSTLSTLADKSLLRSAPDDRYQIHELLRQCAAEKLALSPEDIARVFDAHCAYYADFLYNRWDDVLGGRQLEATAEIKADLENIRAAWQWAVEQGKIEDIRKSAETPIIFYQFQSRYVEAARTLERAAQRLTSEEQAEPVDRALLTILIHLGWFYIRLGRLEDAETVIAQCRTIYDRLDIPPVPNHATDPSLALGIIASIRGDYAEAARLGAAARQLSEAQGHRWNRQLAYYLLARAALLQGEYEAARGYAQQAYDITQAVEDRWFEAYCLNELGNVAGALHDYAAAKEYYEESYTLRRAFDDPEGMAVALNRLGEIANQQQDYAEAERLYQQSLAIYRRINDRGGLATSLNGLGNTDVATGDFQAARQHYHRALRIAAEMQYLPLILSILTGAGELLLRIGQTERGLDSLALALHHPATEHETKERVQQLISAYAADLAPDVLTAPDHVDELPDLTDVTTNVLTELLAPPQATEVAQPPRQPHLPKAEPPLIESLSERELEVLRYIGAGLQNREIAQELTVTLSTVKTHINNIYRKLDVNNRVQALSRGRELDLL
ncbi:MAG: tetratricopeptide repeat protein, partial [Anaerolineae bacterium]|nr:tetratricopeptide repeat protein [Anaerolineae bacterium]